MKVKLIFCAIFLLTSFSGCSSIDYLDRQNGNQRLIDKSSNQLSLLTYNINVISEKDDGQIDSLMTFVNNKKYDFVLFQELFHEGSRDEIVEKADSNFYKTIISRVDHLSFPDFLFQDAGLFMMSKYPSIDLSGLDFGSDIKNSNGSIFILLEKEFSRTYDFLANKSALGTLFDIGNNRKLFLFTSHTQALGSKENKELQISQIYDFINAGVNTLLSSQILKENEGLVVILAGDFNVDAYNNVWRENRVLHEDLMTLLGNPRDLHKEYNGEKREYTWNFRSTSHPRRFDYVFAFDSLAGNNFAKLSVDEMRVIDIKDSSNTSISDHQGIETSIKIGERFINQVHKGEK